MSEITAAATALAKQVGEVGKDRIADLVTYLLGIVRKKLEEKRVPRLTDVLDAAEKFADQKVSETGSAILNKIAIPLAPPIVLPTISPELGEAAQVAIDSIDSYTGVVTKAYAALESAKQVLSITTELKAQVRAGVLSLPIDPYDQLQDLETFLLESLDGLQFPSSEPPPNRPWFAYLSSKLGALLG